MDRICRKVFLNLVYIVVYITKEEALLPGLLEIAYCGGYQVYRGKKSEGACGNIGKRLNTAK